MTDTCAPIRSELSALRARRQEQAELVAGLPNNAGKQHAQEVLDGIDADIAASEEELELCEARADQAENPQDLAITGRVESVVCHAASSEVLADEPYLLIASFDMTNSVNLGVVGFTLPAIDVFKYGPWLGVNEGETQYASHLSSNPAFWDLDSDPRPIAEPQDVIFLVAMCENDASSPDSIRGGVKDRTARRPRDEHQPGLRRLRPSDDQQHDRHDRDDPRRRHGSAPPQRGRAVRRQAARPDDR